MKLIILTEEDSSIPDEILRRIGRKNIWFVTTKGLQKEEEKEYEYLQNTIEGFLRTNREVMIAKFSGNENVTKKLGDERSEMLVYIGKNNGMTEYKDTFLNFIDTFYKETV